MTSKPALSSESRRESSRIFIRNVPPSLNDESFRTHFSHPDASSVTDARFFPKRRIGYVGYKTPQEAQQAVTYFDKTFIGSAKIRVEIALAYDHAEPADLKRKAVDIEDKENKVKENDESDDPAKKQKLAEFIQVMGAAKGDQTWKDALENDPPSAPPAIEDAETRADDKDLSDEAWLKSKISASLDADGANISPAPIKAEEEPVSIEDQIRAHGRLYLRNLLFTVTEDDLRTFFAKYSSLKEVHVPVDSRIGKAKGFAFLLFGDVEEAVNAYKAMDRQTFQGRLLHIMPAQGKRETQLDEIAISKLPLKQQQKIRQKMEAANSTHKWNPLYMNMDDVVTSVSARMGIDKAELLDATSSDAAVKQALAETHVIQETKSYFANHGIDLDSFKPGRARGDTAILVKNFPHSTGEDELRQLFEAHGPLSRLIFPPYGTMALVEFAHATHGRAAFATLKYKRIGNSILFLEKAPKDVFTAAGLKAAVIQTTLAGGKTKLNVQDLLQEASETNDVVVNTTTLFMKNLNFTTTDEKLRETFSGLSGFVSARVKTRPDAKKPGQTLSMGFGFAEFKTKEDAAAALATMNNYNLDGHQLDVRVSQKELDAGQERRKAEQAAAAAAKNTKVIVKNVPFEASKADIRTLLGAYGKLRSVRLPKNFSTNSRGFAFAEFTSTREAEAAMEALRNTHLLGRRLHLEYAKADAVDAEEEIERMQRKVGSQVDKVAIHKLTDNSRQRFRVDDDGGGGVVGGEG